MKLSDDDVIQLKEIWDNNEPEQFARISARDDASRQTYGSSNTNKGYMLASAKCKWLGDWYREKFDIQGPLGGQLALLHEPLGVHADVLFNINDHFTQKEHSTTRYAVLETDCTEPLHTYVFDQYVDRTKWTGLKDGTDAIEGLTDVPIKGMEGLDHLFPNAAALGLTIKDKIELPLGEIISWPSHYLHSGQSFASAGGSWKFHITIITPTTAIK